MGTLTRYFLAWLLMLAIPLQGFAATAMLFCAPSHHNIVAGKYSMFSGTTQQATVQHHAHHMQDKATSQASDVAADQAKTLADKCSACTTCCIGSVIISTQIFAPLGLTNSELIPFIQKTIVSYSPEELDPPPKSFLA